MPDSNGDFHLFWPDSRTGTYQIYFALVSVKPDGSTEPAKKEGVRVEEDITRKVALYFDPIEYDAQAREEIISVRLQNISDETLYRPISVEVKGLGKPAPTILNADNQKTGAGAIFDYSQVLGGTDALHPKGVSGAIPWKFGHEHPFITSFTIRANIKGFVRNTNQPPSR